MNYTAIIVPTWNNEDLTLQAFDSLLKYTSNFRLIWIDNGSEKESRDKVSAFLMNKAIPVYGKFNEKNLGFAKAINQGIRIALEEGLDPIVFMNNDITLTAGWMGKLKEALYWDFCLGVVGSIHNKGIQSYSHFAEEVGYRDQGSPERYFNSLSLKLHYTPRSVPFSLAMFPASVIKRIGFLDEDFYPALGEDNDYCDRIRAAGYKLAFVLNCFTYHERRASVRCLPDYRAVKIRNEKLLWKKRKERENG